MRKILNYNLQIEPIPHESFVSTQKESYEEVGKLIAKDERVDIPIGATVFFESWMAKKYPDLKHEGKFYWLVPFSEIGFYEIDE